MNTLLRLGGYFLGAFLLVVLPFWVFLRGVVWLYTTHGWHPWLAVTAMACVVFFVVLIMVIMFWDWLAGPQNLTRGSVKMKKYLVGAFILVYLSMTLFYLSGKHAKTEAVRKEYRALHPYLRLALGTWIWLDSEVMITDGARLPEDYSKMGLKQKGNSLHYKQSTGYVHAMDLRTQGRSAFRNALLKGYFYALGFNTLRHKGTGDHLHVSLSVKDKPGAI